MTLRRRTLLTTALAAPAVIGGARAQGKTVVDFLFPVAVGGPITKIVDGYAQDFMRANPDIEVRPVYAGSYVDTLTKAQTAAKSGQAPTMAVLLSTDAYTLIDDGLVEPIDELGDTKAWLAGFYPAFLRNTDIDGHQWGVPFQRSTIVMFLNQDLFRQAGLDPAQPPATWAAHADAAAKLSQKDVRWGTEIPATGFTYWLFQALVAEAGGELANANGTAISYDTPASRKALDYWLSLQKSGATPPGLVEWGTTPRDFLEGRSAIIWTTTGNCRTSAPTRNSRSAWPCCRLTSAAAAGPAAAISTCSRARTRHNGRPACASCNGSRAPSDPQNGASTPAMWPPAPMPGRHLR